jgi:transposase
MPLLNLPNYTYTIIDENDNDIHIQITLKDTSKPPCLYCQANSKEVQSYGKRKRHFMDIPIRGKRVGLNIDVPRYRCKKCKKIFNANLPDMSNEYKMSSRLEKYIKQQSILRPYSHVANEVGVSNATVYVLFCDYKKEKEDTFIFETPKVMGIDEIHLAKQPRCVITNIEERTIIDMLKDRKKPTVIKYLKNIKEPHIILRVTMDMWKPYRDSVIDVLPHAKIIIDKFHVVRMVNDAVDKCRREIRKTLPLNQRRDLKNDRYLLLKRESQLKPREQLLVSHWKVNYPTLGKVYELKEAFYYIYEANTPDEAYNRYETWESKLESDVKLYFEDLHKAVSNWHNEIFSYFNYPVTNAYTESMNSVIRHIDRMGRSYRFESIRAKILYAPNLHHISKKPKFNKQYGRRGSNRMPSDVDSLSTSFMMSKSIPPVQKLKEYDTKNYGVSLDRLAQMLEDNLIDFEA